MSDSLSLTDEERVIQSQPRFSIMYLLFIKRRVGFIDMQKVLGLTPGNLDHHIRKLEEIDLVQSRSVLSWKPLVSIEITSKGVEMFREYIHKLKALLEKIPDNMLHSQDG